MKPSDIKKILYFGTNGSLILNNYVIESPCNMLGLNEYMLINHIYKGLKADDFTVEECIEEIKHIVNRTLHGTIRELTPDDEKLSFTQALLQNLSNPSDKTFLKGFLVDCFACYDNENSHIDGNELSPEQFINCLPLTPWIVDCDEDSLLEFAKRFIEEHMKLKRFYGL